MTDREKVINDLQDAVNDDWMWQHADFYALTMQKAISLLQEQEAEIERLKRPDCEHAEHDSLGCLGYCGCSQDDEPIDVCKNCEAYTGNRTEGR